MAKSYTTMDAFWESISRSISSNNHPVFHPCCKSWTTRAGKRFRTTHSQSVKWKQLFSAKQVKDCTPREHLSGLMVENGWPFPIRVNCQCLVAQNHAQIDPIGPKNTKPRKRTKAENQMSLSQIDNQSHSQQRLLLGAPVYHKPGVIASAFSEFNVCQSTQIAAEKSTNLSIEAQVVESMARMENQGQQSLEMGRNTIEEIKYLSERCHSSFQASSDTTTDLVQRLQNTTDELKTVTHRMNDFDQKMDLVCQAIDSLNTRFSATFIENFVVKTLTGELEQLKMKMDQLSSQKVGAGADLGCRRGPTRRMAGKVRAAEVQVREASGSGEVELINFASTEAAGRTLSHACERAFASSRLRQQSSPRRFQPSPTPWYAQTCQPTLAALAALAA